MATDMLAVAGGYRAGGNSDLLLTCFVKGAEAGGARVRTVFLRDLDFTSCIGCELCAESHECLRFADDLSGLYSELEGTPCLILASPVYNYNVTALMKAFIDRLYPFYDFTPAHPRDYTSHLAAGGHRRAAVLAVCEQTRPADLGFALDAMGRPLEALGYRTTERVPAYGFFERGAIRRDEGLLAEVERRGLRFARHSAAPF